MDWEGKVENAKPTCATSGEVLQPGSIFHSGLLFEGGLFQRLDFSPAAWEAQDQGRFISWWRQKVPRDDEPRVRPIDAEALLGIFQALKGSTERAKQCFVYVVALFLMRAKKLKYVDSVIETAADGERRSFVLIEDRIQHLVHRVRDPQMSREEEGAVQRNLMEVIAVGEETADS